ncbi:MAG: hypothetical protein ACYC35_01155 [Pirellulales bacterium]
MRRDFNIGAIDPIKVALKSEQVKQHQLPPGGKPKTTSANYNRFVKTYGKAQQVYELEAVAPETIQDLLTAAIDSVLDIDNFNAEVDQEKRDAAKLENIRRRVHAALADMSTEDDEDE